VKICLVNNRIFDVLLDIYSCTLACFRAPAVSLKSEYIGLNMILHGVDLTRNDLSSSLDLRERYSKFACAACIIYRWLNINH
jgi:hypothetical protein